MVAITVTTVTAPSLSTGRKGGQPKRGIRGSTGGVYIGPNRPNSSSHATGIAGGGVEDSTGYRESDNYDASGGTGGGIGFGDATVNSSTRGGTGQTRTAYTGDGVQGGSTPGKPFDTTGRAEDTGTDRFGRTMGAGTAAGLGHYTYTNFDGRATTAGSRRQAAVGRGSLASGTGPADSVTGETISFTPNARPTRASFNQGLTGSARAVVLIAPTVGNAADPAAGTVGVVGGAGKVQIDLHADDITGGVNLRKGAEVVLFKRRTDTDEDQLSEVARFTADGGTDITDAVTGMTAGTYAVYARYLYGAAPSSGGNATGFGPWSARGTVVVS